MPLSHTAPLTLTLTHDEISYLAELLNNECYTGNTAGPLATTLADRLHALVLPSQEDIDAQVAAQSEAWPTWMYPWTMDQDRVPCGTTTASATHDRAQALRRQRRAERLAADGFDTWEECREDRE